MSTAVIPERRSLEAECAETLLPSPLRNILPRVRRRRDTPQSDMKLIGAMCDARHVRTGIKRLAINEENALLNADATDCAPPWGDGERSLSFDGLMKIATPLDVSALGYLMDPIIAAIDLVWTKGGRSIFVVVNDYDAPKLLHLCDAAARIPHALSRETVDVIMSASQKQGCFLIGALTKADPALAGTPVRTVYVEVEPQLEIPDAPTIYGYAFTELSRRVDEPDAQPALISVFETLRVPHPECFVKVTDSCLG